MNLFQMKLYYHRTAIHNFQKLPGSIAQTCPIQQYYLKSHTILDCHNCHFRVQKKIES